MSDMMKKMMEAKKGTKTLSPVEKDAKESVLNILKQQMEDMMANKVKGVKKVTVASDDKAGLTEGLEKAKDMLSSDESPEELTEEGEGTPTEEHMDMMDGEHDQPDDEASLDAKIQMLLQKKQALKK